MNCPKCNTKNTKTAKFCIECGEKFNINKRSTGKTCPYCHSVIKPSAEIITCPSCETPHHKECWVENKGCTIFGCNEKTLVNSNNINLSSNKNSHSDMIVHKEKKSKKWIEYLVGLIAMPIVIIGLIPVLLMFFEFGSGIIRSLWLPFVLFLITSVIVNWGKK
jgi:hypothetical protein